MLERTERRAGRESKSTLLRTQRVMARFFKGGGLEWQSGGQRLGATKREGHIG